MIQSHVTTLSDWLRFHIFLRDFEHLMLDGFLECFMPVCSFQRAACALCGPEFVISFPVPSVPERASWDYPEWEAA